MNFDCRRKMAIITIRLSDHLIKYMQFQLKCLPTRFFVVKSTGNKMYEAGKINVNTFPATVFKNRYGHRLTFYPK